MLKKIISFILIAFTICVFNVSAFALPSDSDVFKSSWYLYNVMKGGDDSSVTDLDDALYGNDIETTKQFLFTITRPEGDEIVFSASYAICGISGTEGLSIAISRYNSETQKYEALADTDGVSSWDDIDKLFTKEVKLNEGANKIKVVVYKKSEKDNLKLGENLQVNIFTVTLINSSKKDNIVKNGPSLGDIFNLRGRL